MIVSVKGGTGIVGGIVVNDDLRGPIAIIETTKGEIEERKGASGTTDLLQISVENEEGLTGRFTIRMVIESGRPKIIVDAHKKSRTHKFTSVNATADWNL